MTLRDRLREKLPVMAGKAASGQRKAAIRLHCLECCGGSQKAVVECTGRDCFLYLYRLGRLGRFVGEPADTDDTTEEEECTVIEQSAPESEQMPGSRSRASARST